MDGEDMRDLNVTTGRCAVPLYCVSTSNNHRLKECVRCRGRGGGAGRGGEADTIAKVMPSVGTTFRLEGAPENVRGG